MLEADGKLVAPKDMLVSPVLCHHDTPHAQNRIPMWGASGKGAQRPAMVGDRAGFTDPFHP